MLEKFALLSGFRSRGVKVRIPRHDPIGVSVKLTSAIKHDKDDIWAVWSVCRYGTILVEFESEAEDEEVLELFCAEAVYAETVSKIVVHKVNILS